MKDVQKMMFLKAKSKNQKYKGSTYYTYSSSYGGMVLY